MFLLIDEGTVRQYKADLTDEIEPQINELLERAEKGAKALCRKESLIQTKVRPPDLHKYSFCGRILSIQVQAAQAAQSRPARAPTGTSASNKLEARRLQMLAKQRERLEEELEALESEVEQLVSQH